MKRIAIDMDEVMADTLGHQIAWLQRERGCSLTREDLRSGKKPRNVVAAAHIEALEAHMHSGIFFADIPVMPNCQAVVNRLHKHYEIFVTTAAMDYPRSCNAKFDWLEQHFPVLGKDSYVFCGDKAIVHADFLIDDSPKHFKGFVGEGILYDAPHNANEQGYTRVRSWQDVATRFLADL